MVGKYYRKLVFEKFAVGNLYTNFQIAEIMNSCRIEVGIDDTNLSKYKAVSMLKKFFNVESKVYGSGGESKRFYKIVERK